MDADTEALLLAYFALVISATPVWSLVLFARLPHSTLFSASMLLWLGWFTKWAVEGGMPRMHT